MSGGQKAPAPYQPTGQAAADTSYQAATSAMQPVAQSALSYAPQAQTQANAQIANPYAATAQTGASQVAQLGQPVGTGQIAAGNSLMTGANQVMQTAMDPQQALYGQQYQKMLDQQGAINAMNGVAGSPYAAGLEGQAGSNFNIDWQNAQLGRMLSGLSGAASADTAGANLQAGGLNTISGTSAAPTQAYTSNINSNLSALSQGAGVSNAAVQPMQSFITDLSTYLGLGQSATAGAQDAAKINNAQAAAEAAGFGKLFGDITGMFSGSGGGAQLLSAIGA